MPKALRLLEGGVANEVLNAFSTFPSRDVHSDTAVAALVRRQLTKGA